MKKFKVLISSTLAALLFAAPLSAQNPCDYSIENQCPAYEQSNEASYVSIGLPLAAIVVAGVLIATTDRHHSHSHYSGYSSHSHSHSHSHASSR